jgi:hypothetical protein
MDIVEIAIHRAIKQLGNLGCKLKVIRGDGAVLVDTLPVAKPKRTRRPIKTDTGYQDKLKVIQPGEVVNIEVPEGYTQKDIQACVTSHMATLYGNGSYVSERTKDGKYITILRIE